MLSLGRLTDHSVDYYLGRVASSAEDYYLGHGEAPGRWTGAGRAEFGLDGQVDAAEFGALLRGNHPRTLEHLTAGNRKVKGWDFCFRAPKSVSLLFGLGDPDLAGTVVAAHEEAVDAAFGWVEREALRSRRGRNGIEAVHTTGFAGAAFRHRTSREGDPHLHTHVVVPNLVRGTDGRWATPHSNLFHHLAATAGYLYESHLRAVLTEELGVEWEPVVNGIADIAGFDDDVMASFSKRRAQIEAHLRAAGQSSARAREIASLATRAPQGHGKDAHRLRAGWWEEAEVLGVTPDTLAAVVRRVEGRTLPSAGEREAFARHLSGPFGLTEKVSAFTRHDVVRAFSEFAGPGATVAEVEGWADDYLARPELRQLPGHSRRSCAPFHSTADMLAIERSALRAVAERRDAGFGLAPEHAVARAVAARPSLSLEQVAVVESLTTSGHGVEALVAKAGTGKTFSLDACREAWEASDRTVMGCALAGRTAERLQDDTGIPSTTIAALLLDVDGEHSDGLPPGGVLVVDEAGMVGTRLLARLIGHAGRRDVKVVLVGDPKQLPEIEAGGMIRGIEARFGALALTENRRQRHAWERAALDDIHHGQVDSAIAAYDAHGRVVRGDNAVAVREAMVGDWWAARLAGQDGIMLAVRHSDVDDLNARARVRMREAGRLDGRELVVDERPYQTGDEIMTLKNARNLGVLNGTLGTVTAVDSERHTLTMRTAKGQDVTLPRWYLDAGHVVHAYAVTAHKAQGMTTERAFVLGTDDLYREMGYTAMSRGKDANHLYVVGGPEREPDDHHHTPEPSDPDEIVFAALERSRAKSLAVDELHADPARRLRALHAERRRLAPVVAASLPDPETELPALHQARQRAVSDYREAERAVAATRARPGRRRPKPQQAWATARLEEAQQRVAEIEERTAALARWAVEREQYIAEHHDELVRATAVEEAIAKTLRERVAEVEALPPGYLIDLIGEPPALDYARKTWRSAARIVENQRAALGVDDEGSVLGPEPHDSVQLAAWRAAGRDIEVARTLMSTIPLDLRGPEVADPEPDLSLGLEM